ncbi:uncharacterized protein LOC111892298 isoform X1 [Lactuca sativa]|uniref:uncharacterized protein LOC111892298 isoform X1 n=1 Tax=Lactuca sativa TaxID=4236 RepID=UPI000CD8893D|nr:uncharacterized protein LOC111892298 isoform X1 [Lactuca sativa]XP_023744156.1 uncharacterized protein LOC111892298 isoform X1 [Lactuca sativa]XP_042757899.1 uncharacterized protein LOC111892298 isoform X1 [Lactuca sativa]XP_052619830.1 uncharacterized protein LOC111892298 isoform X1 [Lactuca sativa]
MHYGRLITFLSERCMKLNFHFDVKGYKDGCLNVASQSKLKVDTGGCFLLLKVMGFPYTIRRISFEVGFESFHVLGSCCSKPDMISGLIWEKWINLLTTTRYGVAEINVPFDKLETSSITINKLQDFCLWGWWFKHETQKKLKIFAAACINVPMTTYMNPDLHIEIKRK